MTYSETIKNRINLTLSHIIWCARRLTLDAIIWQARNDQFSSWPAKEFAYLPYSITFLINCQYGDFALDVEVIAFVGIDLGG